MNAEIMSIGTELLLGEITDTNATWIARQLRDIGINLFYITAIGDNEERITKALRDGLERSDLIITSGGLGPTVDDMTRQCVAAATNRELVFHQHLLDAIAARFAQFGSQMTENNRQQAYVPANAIIVENPVGTAPSYIVESEKGTIISLPGVPREMKYLMEHRILPYLREKMGLPAIIKARILHTAGIGESSLDDQITDLMKLTNPTVGLAAHSGQTDIRITARADSEAEADTMIAETEAHVRERVGRFVYGVNGAKLDETLAQTLQQKGVQIVVCEAGTKGQLAERMDKLPQNAIKSTRTYTSVADLQSALAINADSLRETAIQAVDILCQQEAVPVGLCVLHQEDGNAGLAIKTRTQNHNRQLNLGSDSEAVTWAFQWGLGYIWRYLNEEEAQT